MVLLNKIVITISRRDRNMYNDNSNSNNNSGMSRISRMSRRSRIRANETHNYDLDTNNMNTNNDKNEIKDR